MTAAQVAAHPHGTDLPSRAAHPDVQLATDMAGELGHCQECAESMREDLPEPAAMVVTYRHRPGGRLWQREVCDTGCANELLATLLGQRASCVHGHNITLHVPPVEAPWCEPEVWASGADQDGTPFEVSRLMNLASGAPEVLVKVGGRVVLVFPAEQVSRGLVALLRSAS